MKKLLWLDDIRNPIDYVNDTDFEVIWVKSYNEFINYLNLPIQFPDMISFDHDLGEDKTGYDCAKYLVDMCMNMKLKLPDFKVHSANPVGKENIECLLNNYKKYYS